MATPEAQTGRRPRWPRWLGLAVLAGVLCVAAYLLSEGWGLVALPVSVRAAEPSDPVADRYLGFDSEDTAARNVLVVTGPFAIDTSLQKRTWLSAAILLVKDGVIEVGNSFSVGRSNNRIGSSTWGTMSFTLAIGERDTADGHVIELGCSGQTVGSHAACPILTTRLDAVARQALPGRMRARTKYIAYVEGDRPFAVEREMSAEAFAAANPAGKYLVVMVEQR